MRPKLPPPLPLVSSSKRLTTAKRQLSKTGQSYPHHLAGILLFRRLSIRFSRSTPFFFERPRKEPHPGAKFIPVNLGMSGLGSDPPLHDQLTRF
jgi:hypothetical protein